MDAVRFALEKVDRGLNALQKPFLHLHTQFNRDLPWDTIDMDFMNLNQSAPATARRASSMRACGSPARSWSDTRFDPEVHDRIDAWMRAARAWRDWQGAKFCRFGDNMRQVAVTEGDKVAAEMTFGHSRPMATEWANSRRRWTPFQTQR